LGYFFFTMKRHNTPPIVMPKLFFCCCLLLFSFTSVYAGDKIVIARNGAGFELVENSLPALTLAASQGVDTVELPVNCTADGQLIVFRDLTLNRLTDVAEVFPDKKSVDGDYYVVDLSLAEIRQLRVKNTFENRGGALSFSIPTLHETLALIRHLEEKLDRQTGISVEIVAPEFYAENGRDISQQVIDTLIGFGYPAPGGDRVFLQSASSDELQRIHDNILVDSGVVFQLIQIVRKVDGTQAGADAGPVLQLADHDWLLTNTGLRLTASYASGIALPCSLVFSPEGTALIPSYLEGAHKYGMKIFLYETQGPESLPAYAGTMQALLSYYYSNAEVDGLYTDYYSSVQKLNTVIAEEEKRKAELPEFFSNLNLTPPAPRKEEATPEPLYNGLDE
jgi:glycerophosphoryl diester phosphodiesterase